MAGPSTRGRVVAYGIAVVLPFVALIKLGFDSLDDHAFLLSLAPIMISGWVGGLGPSLVTAAIVLWNSVYLDRALEKLRRCGEVVSEALLAHVGGAGKQLIKQGIAEVVVAFDAPAGPGDLPRPTANP